MDASMLLRQLLRLPPSSIHLLSTPVRPQTRTFALLTSASAHPQARYLSIPRVLQPSFWGSMIPKPLRRSSNTSEIGSQPVKPKKEWNPATPYIVLALLVGSQAIQSLWLKRDMDHFSRQAEVEIGVLREVIERVQRGEDVDVEKVLGTGDPKREKEWQELLREIGEEEVLFNSKKRRRAERKAAAEAAAAAAESKEDKKSGGDLGQEVKIEVGDRAGDAGKLNAETYKGAKFY